MHTAVHSQSAARRQPGSTAVVGQGRPDVFLSTFFGGLLPVIAPFHATPAALDVCRASHGPCEPPGGSFRLIRMRWRDHERLFHTPQTPEPCAALAADDGFVGACAFPDLGSTPRMAGDPCVWQPHLAAALARYQSEKACLVRKPYPLTVMINILPFWSMRVWRQSSQPSSCQGLVGSMEPFRSYRDASLLYL
jgi:hypothetical protein